MDEKRIEEFMAELEATIKRSFAEWDIEETKRQVQESPEIQNLDREIAELKAINSIFERRAKA